MEDKAAKLEAQQAQRAAEVRCSARLLGLASVLGTMHTRKSPPTQRRPAHGRRIKAGLYSFCGAFFSGSIVRP